MPDLDYQKINSFIKGMKCNSVDEEKLASYLNQICLATKIPVINKSSDDPYSEKDFHHLPQRHNQNFKLLMDLISTSLSYVVNNRKPFMSQSFLSSIVNVIVTCGQYQHKDSPWKSSPVASEVLNLLLKPDSSTAPALDILTKEKEPLAAIERLSLQHPLENCYQFGSVIKLLLQTLSNEFQKDSWKNNPGMRHFYLWFLYALLVSFALDC